MKEKHVCTETDHDYFDEAIENYEAGRFHSLCEAYNWMTACFYSTLRTVDGAFMSMALDDRPSMKQFYDYMDERSKQKKER